MYAYININIIYGVHPYPTKGSMDATGIEYFNFKY